MPKYTVVKDLRYGGVYHRAGSTVELPARVARRFVVDPYEEPKAPPEPKPPSKPKPPPKPKPKAASSSPEEPAQVSKGEAPAVTKDKLIGPQDKPAPENTPGNE